MSDWNFEGTPIDELSKEELIRALEVVLGLHQEQQEHLQDVFEFCRKIITN